VTDVIAMVESGQFGNADIYITPPDSLDTDEDSADEDQGGLIDNLRGQLDISCRLRQKLSSEITGTTGDT